MNWQRINRNSLSQFWHKRLPSLTAFRGGTYNVGRNKAKREERARSAAWRALASGASLKEG